MYKLILMKKKIYIDQWRDVGLSLSHVPQF